MAEITLDLDDVTIELDVGGGAGTDGSDGADGSPGGHTYTFSTTTTDADPGPGLVRFNHATPASANEIYISDQTAATGNPDIETELLSWDDSTNTALRGTLVIVEPSTPANMQIFNITGASTDNTDYVTLAVTHVDGSGSFADAAALGIQFARTGNKGTDGAGTGDVVGPGSATDNAIVRYDLTTGKLIQDSGVIIDDSDNVTGITDITVSGQVKFDTYFYLQLFGGATPLIRLDDGDSIQYSRTINKIQFSLNAVQRASIDYDGLALETGARVNEFSTDGTLSGNSSTAVPVESAVKTYVDVLTGFYNGAAIDSPVVTVTSNGTIITLTLEKSGGGDIDFKFSDGIHSHDCTPAETISLTAGTDTSPQINYIYILQSTLLLTVSTSSFPSAEHAPIATVLCQTAASLQTDGAYKVHAWTDHISGSDDQGHLAHLNAWIRCQNATWTSGVVLTPSVGAATFDVATTSGVILQLHDHAFPVFDTSTGSEIYMVNYPGDNFKVAQNLTQTYVDVDANGTTLGTAATDFYNLVIWGAVNEASGDCKLFVNLPDGAYNNDSGSKASNDDDNTAVYTIPADFTGVGFLIARLTVSEVAGTYTIEQNQDLRGSFPSTAAGGGSSGGSEFADNVFRIQDDGDATKEISFQASSITTGTVRTIIMPDADVNLGTDFESADVDILKADTDDNLAAGFSTTAHDIGELNAETYVAIAEGGNIKTCNNGEGQTDLDPMVATGTVIIEVTNDAEATTAFTTNSFTKVSGDDHLTTSGFTYLYYLTTVGSESHCYIQAMQ